MDAFLETFLKHHIERAKRGEITNTIAHCHVKGLYSIMLNDNGQGNRIRMFFADNDHELYKNGGILHASGEKMSLAIHSHHCDLTLIGIFGNARNHIYDTPIPNSFGLFACEYKSNIYNKEQKNVLFPTGGRYTLDEISNHFIYYKHPTYMKSTELHTISLKKDTSAAWLVIEGKEDPNYSSICYTNQPHFETDGYYGDMKQEQVVDCLERCLGI